MAESAPSTLTAHTSEGLGGYSPNFVVGVITRGVAYLPDTSARGPKSSVASTGFRPSSGAILRAYVGSFDQVFIPYNGPDEPLGFEPEDYPVR